MRRAAFWVLLCAILGIYAAMVGGTLAIIAREAGAPAFDMRPAGYSVEEARQFLGALTDNARAIYLGPQRWLDAVYPALLTITMVWSARWASDGRAVWLVRLVTVFACLNMLADYAENIAVAGMLAQAPQAVSDRAIMLAANLTRAKSAFGTLAMVLWGVLLVMRAARKLTGARG